MGTLEDDVRKHRSDIEKYLAYLTLLNAVRQGADLMLSHHEQVLRQCSNEGMANKLQDLVCDVREIFRGDSKHLKGPEAFRLMLTHFESLQTQLRDEEATRSRKTVKFNFAVEGGSGGMLMAAVAPTPQKPASPCFFAAAYHCLKVQLVDADGRPVKKCPMQAQDRCARLHDAATCRSAYAGDDWFKKNLDSYVEVAKSNGNRVPSKEQLQDAGLLPKWSKGSGGRGGGGRGRGGRGLGCGGGNANTASGGSPSPSKSKVDMSCSVVAFAWRSHAHMAAVFEPEDVVFKLHGASYVSTAGGDVLDDVPAAGTKDRAVTVNASVKVNAQALLSNRFSSLAGRSVGRYGPCVTSPGGAPVVAAPRNTSKEKMKAVSAHTIAAHTIDIPPVPSGVSSYNSSSEMSLLPDASSEAKSGTGKGQGVAHWSQCDLAVQ